MAAEQQLEKLYITKIKPDRKQEIYSEYVLNKVVKTVVEKAKEKCDEFNELYQNIFFGGSHFDGLKINSPKHDFDLNIIFRIPKQVDWYIGYLGDDVRRPNFASLCSSKHPSSNTPWNKLVVKNRHGHFVVSSKKMFSILQTAVDRALTEIKNVIEVNNKEIRVTRATGAPVILNVMDGNRELFTIDLVPCFKLELLHLKTACPDLSKRVLTILSSFSLSSNHHFMAIALKNASSDTMEIHFPEIERSLLTKTGGCVHKVVRILKYLRDTKGGTISQLWSHLLKVSLSNGLLNFSPLLDGSDASGNKAAKE